MKQADVIIIGAGAAGLMCAIEAGRRGRQVILLEKADKIGKKILISGGGRCNFTNLSISADNYLSQNPHFCKSALSRYRAEDFIALLESHNLSWHEKTLGQLFCDQKSPAVVRMLKDECGAQNVSIELNCAVGKIKKQQAYYVETNREIFQANSLVIATGGPSIPGMGATDFALQLAQEFNINTLPFIPALVPFIFPEDELNHFIKELAGTALKVELCTKSKCFTESILFTHRGISGPAALQLSSYWKKPEEIYVNFSPDINILEWLINQQQAHPNAELKTILSFILPKRLAGVLCREFLHSEKMKQLLPKTLEDIANKLSQWPLSPSATEGMRTAEVCTGGIDTNELSSKTLECKKSQGLYFIGEGVDVTGHLGGFNFQWAWASGWCAGQYV